MAHHVDTGGTAIELTQIEQGHCTGVTAPICTNNGILHVNNEGKSNISQTLKDTSVSSLITKGCLSNDGHTNSLPSPVCSQNSYSAHDAWPTLGNHLRVSDDIKTKSCPCVAEPDECEGEACQPPLNKKCSKECIRLCIFQYPDNVKWYARTEKVTLEKDKAGKLGFHFKEVQSERNHGEKYTLVHSVIPGGPADGKLSMGDYILSANGIALQEKKFLEVVRQSEGKEFHMIKCRPKGLIPLRNESTYSPPYISNHRRPHYHRSESAPSSHLPSEKCIERQENCQSCGSENTRQDFGQLTRKRSHKSTGSTGSHISLFEKGSNPSLTSSSQTSDVNTSGDERENDLQTFLPRVEAEMLRILASNMPRLPHLKVIVIGCESSTLVESLLPRKNPLMSKNEVYAKYNTCLIKKDKECEWLSLDKQQETTQPIVKAVTKSLKQSLDDYTFRNTRPSQCNSLHSKLLQQICQNASKPTNRENFEEVELEILAMHETQIARYCRHVLYSAHCIYIVQFDANNFFENQKSVLTYIQTQLSQIRSFGSEKVQVILVVTSPNKLTPKKMAVIGQSLEEHFSSTFGNQLLYHSTTNLPCYFVFPCNHAIATNHKTNDLSRGGMYRQVSCEDNTISQTRPIIDYSVEDFMHNRDGDNLQHVHCGIRLKAQISLLAFQQQFVSKKYPYQYLIYREQKMRSLNQPIGAQKSDIMRECGVAEETALLEYLHDCGDIICMDYLQYMMSQHLLHSRLSFMVLLSRDHLIHAVQKFIPIPSRSVQDPQCRAKWDDLQTTAEISHHFLLHLLGSDAEVLRIFLDMMNLIYCMDDGTSHLDKYNKSPQYLVPFYLHQMQNRESTGQQHKPQYFDQILYMDFDGFIPHGMFMSIMIQLIGISNETNGTWAIDSQLSGYVTFASDCKLQLKSDELAATIKISAECKMGYHPRNIYALLCQCMKRLRPSKSKMHYKCGPPCPLCQRNSKIHVLDIRDGRGSIWCGRHQLDQEPSVKQWLVKEQEPQKDIVYSETSEPLHVTMSNHIKYLPPSLYKWICDHLNVPYASGHNWEMLADNLGYTMDDIHILRLRHQTAQDPCDSLLQDWGRSNSATLEKLMLLLHKMGRHDLLTDMQQRWYLTK